MGTGGLVPHVAPSPERGHSHKESIPLIQLRIIPGVSSAISHSSCRVLKSLSHVRLFVTAWTCPWNSPGQNPGVGSLSLLQGIFPTQGLNPGLQLSHQGSPPVGCVWVKTPCHLEGRLIFPPNLVAKTDRSLCCITTHGSQAGRSGLLLRPRGWARVRLVEAAICLGSPKPPFCRPTCPRVNPTTGTGVNPRCFWPSGSGGRGRCWICKAAVSSG